MGRNDVGGTYCVQFHGVDCFQFVAYDLEDDIVVCGLDGCRKLGVAMFWDRVITSVMLTVFKFALMSQAHVSGFVLCCLWAMLSQTYSRVGGLPLLADRIHSLSWYCCTPWLSQ